MEPSLNLIMNLNYIFITNISYTTFVKIIFIIFLLFLNIVLVLYTETHNSPKIKQSGFFGSNSSALTNTMKFIYGSAALYSTYLTIKAEHIHQKNIQELTNQNEELQSSCKKAQEEIDNVLCADGLNPAEHPPTFEHINRLPYCVALCKEVFR